MGAIGVPRVGQFIDTRNAGGAERVVFDLSRKLLERGVAVELLHIGNEWLAPACEGAGVPHSVIPWSNEFKHKGQYHRFVWHFSRHLKQRGFALLHSHLFGPVTGAALPARLAGLPAIGTLHDTFSVENSAVAMRLLDVAGMLGTRLITVSRDMQSTFERRWRFPWTRFSTVYNGTDCRQVHAVEQRVRIRAQLGLTGDEVVAVSVGRLNPIKGYDNLLRAWARLERPLHLLIAGFGELEGPLRTLATTLGLDGKVTFLGFRSDVSGLLHAADLFVLASHSEGLSCSIIEAMAAGLPVVVTDVGGNRELIDEGRTGFLVNPGEPDALADRVRLLCEEPERRRRFGQLAARRARTLFSLDAMVDSYLEVYTKAEPRFAAYRSAKPV